MKFASALLAVCLAVCLAALQALAQDVPVLSFGVPESLGKVELQNSAVTVTRYDKWRDAYTDGVLSMVPPGKKLDMGVEGQGTPVPSPSPSPAPAPAANATANATKAAKPAEKPKKTGISIATYDSWQAAYLDGYGFPAAGQKEPTAPNKTEDGAAKKGARRLLSGGGVTAPRERI